MTIRSLFAAAGAAALLAGAASAQSALSEKVSSGTYKMDPGHGYVTLTYSHFGFSNPIIQFEDVAAVMEINVDAPAESDINVTIDATSVDSGVEEFNGHLNSADWLDTEAFPTITFVATSLEQTDAETGTMTGDLTIKGVTKPVTLDVKLLGAGPHPLNQTDTIGVEATTTVLRSDFGLGNFAPAVSDEVLITVSGEFNKQS